MDRRRTNARQQGQREHDHHGDAEVLIVWIPHGHSGLLEGRGPRRRVGRQGADSIGNDAKRDGVDCLVLLA